MEHRRRRPLIDSSDRLVLALAVTLILAAGCAPRGPSLPPTEPGKAGAETLIRLLSEAPCPRDMAADLEIVAAPAGRSRMLLTGSARIAWPDRVRIQARAGAFVPVASIAVAGDSAYLSLPRDGAFWSGRSDRVGDSGFLGTASNLLWLLCPGPLLRAIEDPILDRSPDGWTLRGRLPGGERPPWIEARLPRDRSRVSEIIFRDHEGTIRMRSWRSGKRVVGGVAVPRVVRVQSGTDGGWLEVKLLSPHPDPGQSPDLFRLRPAAGARILTEEEMTQLLSGQGMTD